jgi:hypothetical protein
MNSSQSDLFQDGVCFVADLLIVIGPPEKVVAQTIPGTPERIFSKTLNSWKTFVTWKDLDMPRRFNIWAGFPEMSWPLNRISPEEGSNLPLMILNSVVFPAPFGPITAWRSFSCMVKSTPMRTLRPEKSLWMFLIWRYSLIMRPPFH